MILEKDILADMHTHTLFSKHAYSTVKENIEVAKKRGLKYLAITDHYFCNGDNLDKKNEINRINYLGERTNHCENSDFIVIPSAEFNLGQEIFTPNKLNNVVWRPIGLHNWFVDIDILTLDDIFNLFVEAYQNGHNAFVHIEMELHKVHKGIYSVEEIKEFLRKVVDFAREHDIWLEVNESTIITNECGSKSRLYHWLNYAKENGNKIYLGTDAHYCDEVGQFNNAISMLNEIDYPKELILNCNLDTLNTLFRV